MIKALSLKQLIFGGFGLVLVVLAALAVMALRGTDAIGNYFTDYRQAARESLLVNEANATLLRARLAVMQFRATNAETYAQQVNDEINTLVELKAELSTLIQDNGRADTVSGFTDVALQYQTAFSEVVALQAQRNLLVPQLETAGREARRALSELMEEAYTQGNSDAAYLAGEVQQHLMLARFYGEKFLLENLESDQQRTLDELQLANESSQSLERFATGTSQVQSLMLYKDNVGTYAQLFAEIASIIAARNVLLIDEMDKIGPELASGYGSVLADVVDQQNTIGPRAAAEITAVTRSTAIMGVAALAIGALAAFFIGQLISRSLRRAVDRMTSLADGNLDLEIDGADRKDELGDMARALIVFQDNGRDRLRMQEEQAAQAATAEAEKRQSMNSLADSFEANVNGVVSAVSSAAEQMVGLAQLLSQSAERAGERSTAVAAASEEASTNVETVAAASEEMTNSIAEVSQRVGQSASMTDQAARGAESTTHTVSKLATSAQTIGDVISMISDIAEQTNLLALNATIEAARAGEAGKGFAVVASEVKSLAGQTAKATEEISAQITGMQSDTDAVVSAIEKIGSMIQELNGTSSSIAAAVEEQHSATQEIARNTQQAADGTREVSANITEVSTAVQETGQAASEVLAASSQLASEAEQLRASVADFLSSVRAA